MKKRIVLIMIFCLMVSMVLPVYAKEQTLDQYLASAKANRDALAKAQSEKELTEAERDSATKQKQDVENQISSIQNQLKTIESQITKLQADIQTKNEQMKKIMSYVQISNGETNYLEYIFGATDFTDFIYRVSVAEQLGDYNEKLIKEYNQDVKDLDQKQVDLNNKSAELNNKQNELAVLEAKLNKQIATQQEGILDYESEYKVIMSTVNTLKKLGCRGSETMSQCQNRINPPVVNGGGKGVNVSSTNGLYMPILRGYVTSDYGQREEDFHTGIDFSNGVHGDNVYPVAAGIVMAVISPSYSGACGNHIVYVYHNINGRHYTTSYWHMINVSVSPGQTVSASTVLGHMGGLHSEDSCAYGTHVHLNLFNNWQTSNAGRINPRTLLTQIPAKGVYFTSPR